MSINYRLTFIYKLISQIPRHNYNKIASVVIAGKTMRDVFEILSVILAKFYIKWKRLLKSLF